MYSFLPNELSLSNFNQYAWKMFCLCRLLCSPSCDTLPPPSLANGAPLFWHCQCTTFQQASCSSWKYLTLLLITSSSSSLATFQLCDLSDPVSEWSPLQPAAAWIQNTVLTFSVLLAVWPVSHSAVYSVVSRKSQQWVKALHVDAPGLCFHGHWGPSQLPYCPYTSSLQPLMALWQPFWMYLSPFFCSLVLSDIFDLHGTGILFFIMIPVPWWPFAFNISSTLTGVKYLSKHRCVPRKRPRHSECGFTVIQLLVCPSETSKSSHWPHHLTALNALPQFE